MAKTFIELSQTSPTMRPFADDQISPEDMAEIIRRAKRSERGEDRTIASEELLEELGLDADTVLKLLELLESLELLDEVTGDQSAFPC